MFAIFVVFAAGLTIGLAVTSKRTTSRKKEPTEPYTINVIVNQSTPPAPAVPLLSPSTPAPKYVVVESRPPSAAPPALTSETRSYPPAPHCRRAGLVDVSC